MRFQTPDDGRFISFFFNSCFSQLLQMAAAGGSMSGTQDRGYGLISRLMLIAEPRWNTNLWLGEVTDSARPSSTWTLTP